MYFLLAVFVVLTKLAQFCAVVQLNRHTLPDGLQSVNGSDHNGGCSRVIGGPICVELDEGGRSDLTDCIIPSLGGFQSNWAAGLFTVNRSGQSFYIGFEFSRPVNFTRVELNLFNCPEWGIAAQTITVYEYTFGILNFFAAIARALGHTTANTTSCNSIVRAVIPLELPQNPTYIYVIEFTFDNTSTNIQWVHIAEVRFLEEEGTRPTPSSTADQIPTQQHGATATSIHKTVRPTLSQPILSQGTVQSTLSPETVRPTPENTPLHVGSPVTLVTVVIITIVVILLVIALGVVVLAVIFIRARRKTLEINDFQTTMMKDEKVEYEEVQETQLSTLIEEKKNDAYQHHTMKASVRVPPHADDAAVYEEVRGGGRNQGVGFVMEENKAYDRHLQRGEAVVVSPSEEVDYEEI